MNYKLKYKINSLRLALYNKKRSPYLQIKNYSNKK